MKITDRAIGRAAASIMMCIAVACAISAAIIAITGGIKREPKLTLDSPVEVTNYGIYDCEPVFPLTAIGQPQNFQCRIRKAK